MLILTVAMMQVKPHFEMACVLTMHILMRLFSIYKPTTSNIEEKICSQSSTCFKMSACFAVDVQLIHVQETEKIFNRGKNEAIEDGIQHIKDRLTNTSTNSVAKAMSVYETFTWPRQKFESF
jgi:hypothetical protein